MKIGKNFKNFGQKIEPMNGHLLEIGDDCLVGAESKIILHCPVRCYKEDPRLIINDLTWIGLRCLILPATNIGRCSIIGANSVVCGEIPPYSIYAGNKVIRKRDIGEILNYYIIRKLVKTGFLGVKPTDWTKLKSEHIRHALGYNTEFCYDEGIDFSLSVEDFVEKYAKGWVKKTT